MKDRITGILGAAALVSALAIFTLPAVECRAEKAPGPLVDEGITYLEKGDLDTAISYFTRAIKSKPRFTIAWYNRGLARFMKGEYGKAISDYSRAIKLNPVYVEAYYNRGNAYMKAGRYDEAVEDYTVAIGLRPDMPDPYNNRGYLYLEKFDRVAEACEDFDMACARGDCRNLQAVMAVGVCLKGHGKQDPEK